MTAVGPQRRADERRDPVGEAARPAAGQQPEPVVQRLELARPGVREHRVDVAGQGGQAEHARTALPGGLAGRVVHAGGDLLDSGSGYDTMYGGAGDDTIDGRGGKDVLTGGAGADTFVFSNAAAAGNADTITDFSVSEGDKFNLTQTVFNAINHMGQWNASEFAQFGSVTTADQHIVYQQSTGKVFYDADGSGKASGLQLFYDLAGYGPDARAVLPCVRL